MESDLYKVNTHSSTFPLRLDEHWQNRPVAASIPPTNPIAHIIQSGTEVGTYLGSVYFALTWFACNFGNRSGHGEERKRPARPRRRNNDEPFQAENVTVVDGAVGGIGSIGFLLFYYNQSSS